MTYRSDADLDHDLEGAFVSLSAGSTLLALGAVPKCSPHSQRRLLPPAGGAGNDLLVVLHKSHSLGTCDQPWREGEGGWGWRGPRPGVAPLTLRESGGGASPGEGREETCLPPRSTHADGRSWNLDTVYF